MRTQLSSNNLNPQWRELVSKLISKGKKQDALKQLDKFVESIIPLFQTLSESKEERRTAWLLRIDLLRKWNRKIEALAWICLECELNPENVTAQILKEQLKKELNLFEDGIDEEVLQISESRTNWRDVAGMQELKTILDIDVINPIKNPSLYKKYRLSVPNGILLYGPSGCGKTYIARKLALRIGYSFIEVTPSNTSSIYVHGSQEKIAAQFRKAEKIAPCVLFFDEFDAFAPRRDGTTLQHAYSSEVNEFLTQLNECHQKGILVVGATNLINKIDDAVLRPGRLDIKVFVSPPDYEARIEVFKMYLDKRPLDKINYDMLADYSNLYTYAEIKNLIELAARRAIKENKNINMDHLIDMILANPCSLTEEKINNMRSGKN